MGEFRDTEYNFVNEDSPKLGNTRKVSVIPLVFLIFYEVSGGPFGIEDSVQAAGPLLAILGFLIFPFIWSIPEALVTAEMGTMFPENGGYVVWVSSALGHFWGFQQGWMKWLSGVIDNALYPVLFLDYLKSGIPDFGGGLPRTVAVLILTVALTYMNYRGLNIFFSKRSRHGTPLVGILFSASGVLLLSWMSFQEIIAAENFLYCFGMILEYVAFIKLRLSHPNASRPYKVPLGTAGCILMIVPPTILICVVLALASFKVMIVSIIAMLIGSVLQPCLKHVEKKKLLKFTLNSDLPDFRESEHESAVESLIA
uniref:Uncharacterized protein n=1 Tax=Musa acuminata subsp. malaccensis TaxID=214687 RepID=A0A804KMY5_MUSAM